jgi:acyl-CoA thioesterase
MRHAGMSPKGPDPNGHENDAAEQRAQRAAAAMWAADRTGQALGIELVAVGPGTATLAMTVGEAMVNGHATTHGGYIFTLADSAFAYACNSYGMAALAAQCQISFIRPSKRGDHLVASAREISRTGRSGIYDVRVTVDDVPVAEFRGHSRLVGGSFID